MSAVTSCLDCGARWPDGTTCQDGFHQLLGWEWEDTRLQAVHHLLVLNYHLQHAHLYSQDALPFVQQLLVDFVEHGLTPQAARQQNGARLAAHRRTWKISGGTPGAYAHPVAWTLTTADVVAGGMAAYCENVLAWARSIVAALRASGNLPPA